MEPISFTSKTTYNEYLRLALHRYAQAWPLWFIYIVGAYLIFLSVFTDSISRDDATIMITASLVVMIMLPIRVFFRLRKAYKSNAFAGTEIFWTISESGIAFKQGSLSTEVGWDRIDKITGSKEWIILLYNKKPSLYFQKRFLSPEQMADFKKIIHPMRKGYLKHE